MFGTILASLRDLFPAMSAAVIVRQEARCVGQSFWGWLWLDAFGVGLGTGCGRGEKIQGGKAATEAGCGFEEAACGLSPCHFCHLPFPPTMVQEAQCTAVERCLEEKHLPGQSHFFHLSSLFSSPHVIASFYPLTPSHSLLLRVSSVRKTGTEVVVARKQAAFPVPLPIAPRLHTSPTYFHNISQYFQIFPNIATYCQLHPYLLPITHPLIAPLTTSEMAFLDIERQ